MAHIGEVLADPNRVPSVYNVIYGNRGDAAELLEAVKLQSGARGKWKLFPNLGGLKISPMWVRMLVSPGEVPVTNLIALRVAVDVQVHRATYSLGLANKKPGPGAINDKFTAIVQKAWQQGIEDAVAPASCEPLNGTAGALDPALWFIGKWGCTLGNHTAISITWCSQFHPVRRAICSWNDRAPPGTGANG